MITNVVLGTLIGGGLGFAYYRLIGCATGACPIASNPYIAVGFGIIVGILISLGK